MAAEIVPDDDVAGPEHWHELLLDIDAEALPIDRAVEDARAVSRSQRNAPRTSECANARAEQSRAGACPCIPSHRAGACSPSSIAVFQSIIPSECSTKSIENPPFVRKNRAAILHKLAGKPWQAIGRLQHYTPIVRYRVADDQRLRHVKLCRPARIRRGKQRGFDRKVICRWHLLRLDCLDQPLPALKARR